MMMNKVRALEHLTKLSFPMRLLAVAEDVRSGRDVYRHIAPHDLASALGVPASRQPSTGDGWSFTRYAHRMTIEECVANVLPPSEAVYKLASKVSARRYKTLEKMFAAVDGVEDPSFDFLKPSERESLEETISKEQLEANSMNGLCCLATYCVDVEGTTLEFEGVVEDDGHCITLRTPYDMRDGGFEDLSDSVEERW